MTNQLLHMTARHLGLFHETDPAAFKRKTNLFLDHVVAVGSDHPDLTTRWASWISILTAHKRMSKGLAEDAIEIVLDHAAASYRINPRGLKRDLMDCRLGTDERWLLVEVVSMAHHLEPETIPGPWGLREAGIELERRQFQESLSMWQKFKDFKYRITHRPGPNTITIGR